MIYTVTFNPSVDYIVRVENFKLGMVNRTDYEEILEGGKGINVSIVLNNLGYKSTALGFVAGFTGRQIEKGIMERGCQTNFIHIEKGMSRINVKLKSNQETEINGQGPTINNEHIEALFCQLDRLDSGDILVLAGSIPMTLPEDMYEKIMKRLEGRNIRIIVDATKDLLRNVLKFHPFLIKPNHHELEELFQKKFNSSGEIVEYGCKLLQMGAKNVLVSMAGDGAIFLGENGEIYQCEAPKGSVVNSVGAGDSMVAGFVAGYLEEGTYEHAFKMGVAAGSASAFSPQLATREEILSLLRTIKI